MQRFVMSVSEEIYQELQKERKPRLETVQEVARQIISHYLKNRNDTSPKINHCNPNNIM